jgi:hypothetical protein
MAVLAQTAGDERRHLRLVLDYEYPHLTGSSLARMRIG